MVSSIYAVAGVANITGIIFLSARPRGGDWLKDDIASWKKQDIHTVVSLLTRSEEAHLDFFLEGAEARAIGIQFISVPIEDREVPRDAKIFKLALDKIEAELTSGKKC